MKVVNSSPILTILIFVIRVRFYVHVRTHLAAGPGYFPSIFVFLWPLLFFPHFLFPIPLSSSLFSHFQLFFLLSLFQSSYSHLSFFFLISHLSFLICHFFIGAKLLQQFLKGNQRISSALDAYDRDSDMSELVDSLTQAVAAH